MGTCCSKIDGKSECASFNDALHHPSLEQWQAQISTCQFCQLKGVIAGHLHCCICDACRQVASSTLGYDSKEGSRSYGEPSCNLCAADAYGAELVDGAPQLMGCLSQLGSFSDDEEVICLVDPVRSGIFSTELDAYVSRNCPESERPATCVDFAESSPAEHDLLMLGSQQTLFESDDMEMPEASPILASSSKEGQDVIMFSNIATYEFLGSSMRFARSVSIDDSDGIKLEVRYKHMLPHDVHRSSVNHVSLHDDHVHKRTRSSEMLLVGEVEANLSTRCRKSFRVDSDGLLDLGYEVHEDTTMSEMEDDVLDNDDDDDDFHDITVGVSISSLHTELEGTVNDLSGDPDHGALSVYDLHHDALYGSNSMTMNPYVQDGLHYVTNLMGMLSPNVREFGLGPVYVLSKENMQFISKEEKEWEVRAEAMGMEDRISRAKALSVVSTGDALLFSGANADEFHLIPSLFVQHPKSPVLSPSQEKHGPPRLMGGKTDDRMPEKSTLSVEDIILLLENDDLNEDDFFSLLVNTCAKLSPSSSPCSSSSSSSSLSEASMVWSSPLSSMSSSSTLLSSASSSTALMPWLPSSSSSTLQLPPPSTTCSSLSLPYSLSLPTSCKMSPHTSFEFKVKSSSSTPSTPVFSPIRSRAKRNVAQLKPNALTTGEIAEIWGLLEQRQACN